MVDQENPDKKVEKALFGSTKVSDKPEETRNEQMDQSFYRKQGLDYLYF